MGGTIGQRLVSGWWVTGIIDGEGCLTAGIYVQRGRRQLSVRLMVGQRVDDAGVAQKLLSYFGCGQVSLRKEKKGQLGYRFTLGSKSEVAAAVRHLERYPLMSKKSRDAEIWLGIAREFLKPRGEWVNRSDWLVGQCRRLGDVKKFDHAAVGRAKNLLKGALWTGGRKTWK